MSDYNWCHGPKCHTHKTQDRISGVQGSKVLRTRKIKQDSWNQRTVWSHFCSQGCYNDFANKYVREVIAIAPRTEALETPIDVVKEHARDWRGNDYMQTKILTVDNNGG